MSTALPSLGPYRLDAPLGSGAMGVVWRAIGPTGEAVAIKCLAPKRALAGRSLEEARGLFRHEVEAVARIGHPHVVEVLDHGVVSAAEAAAGAPSIAGLPWLAMTLAEGGSLGDCQTPFAWRALHALLVALLDALAHAHAHGVIHRDIKPANVLLTANGTPLLSDFGLAHALAPARESESQSAILEGAGTPLYMAPEQFDGAWRRFGPWTDLYALGCMAWALACAKHPFRGNSIVALAIAHLSGPRPTWTAGETMPSGLEGWLRAMIARHPEDRFQCAADARAALAEVARTGGQPVSGVAGFPRVDTSPAFALPVSGAAVATLERATLPAPFAMPFETAPTASRICIAATVIDRVRTELATAEPPAEPLPDRPADRPATGFALADPPAWPALETPRVASRALVGLREPPFVGREAERTRMWQVLRDVRATGRNRAILITGTSGQGKTALARWLVHAAHVAGAAPLALTGEHGPGADGAMHQRMLAIHFGVLGVERTEAFDRLRERGIGVREANILSALVDPSRATESDPERGVTPMRPASDRERYRIGLELLESVARAGDPRPLLLVFDDVHWAPYSIGFVRFVLDHPELGPPCVIVCTARTDELARRPFETALLAELAADRVDRIALAPLVGAAHADLVRALSPRTVSAEEIEAIGAHTAGEPLYAVQILDHWARSGSAAPLEGVPSREVLWRAQLDQALGDLTGPSAQALALAVALGTHVNTALWLTTVERARLAFDAADAEALVGGLVAEGLVHRTVGGWFFVHAELRELLLADQTPAARRANHAAIAATLADRAENDVANVQQRVHHLIEADAIDAAVDLIVTEAPRARIDRSAILTEALLMVFERLAPRLAPDDPRRFVIATMRLGAAVDRGRFRAAESLAVPLREAVRHEPPLIVAGYCVEAEVLREMAALELLQGKIARAATLIAESVALAERVGDRRGYAAARAYQGETAIALGDFVGARAAIEEAIACFAPLDRPDAVANGHRALAVIARSEQRPDVATEHLRLALELAEREGLRLIEADALNALAEIERQRGELDAALVHYDATVALCDQLGAASHVMRFNRAVTRLQLGDDARAERELHALLDLCEDEAHGYLLPFLYLACAAAAARRADRPAFDDFCGQAERRFALGALCDPDGALLSDLAAEPWLARGDVERAARARAIGDDQRAQLGW